MSNGRQEGTQIRCYTRKSFKLRLIKYQSKFNHITTWSFYNIKDLYPAYLTKNFQQLTTTVRPFEPAVNKTYLIISLKMDRRFLIQ
jgi:hypothetical protein